MTVQLHVPTGPLPALRFTESGTGSAHDAASVAEVVAWLDGLRETHRFEVERIAFDEMGSWGFDRHTGNLRHCSGRFFGIEGLRVRTDYGSVPEWSQPIIHQPEIGILGFVVKEIDGLLHVLVQAKMEPGNVNTLQVSPTVQATRSNYTRVHGGSSPRYLEYFVEPGRARVLVDVLQSEQGAWFHNKRNRNIVVEVDEDVPPHEDFRWITIGQLQALLSMDNMVNMDARTVLSCIPFARPTADHRPGAHGRFRAALRRSMSAREGALHSLPEVLSWFTASTATHEMRTERVPLLGIDGWCRDDHTIRHREDRHFRVFGARVRADTREVLSWEQPMLEPVDRAVVAFLVRRVGGVLHVLMHARPEVGHMHGVEIAPTVQCIPRNYAGWEPAARPAYLDAVLGARPDQIRFDAVQSEEGGRFHHAEGRYLIVEADEGGPLEESEHFRWLTVDQLTRLLQHGHYLNVQARSLIACLHSLW